MAENNFNITKELRNTTIRFILCTVEDQEIRNKLICEIKKLDYNQPERKLAYFLISNNLIRVYVRAFGSLHRPNYFLQWMNDDYGEVPGISEIANKAIDFINNNHKEKIDGQLLQNIIDDISGGQASLMKQKIAQHEIMYQEYKKELNAYIDDVRKAEI